MTIKGSHLTEQDRQHLETCLNENMKLCDIAFSLDRDPRGIKYEIMNHRSLFVRKNLRNKCGIQEKCKKKRLCNDCESGLCKYCGHIHCDVICDDFQEEPDCKTIRRFPGVCNGCEKVKSCPLPKFYYKASQAHSEYENNISEHKKGPKLSDIEMKQINKIVSAGVKKGHSIEVIIHNNDLKIAPSTIYRYIDDNQFSVKNIDLKRKVRYKQRTTKKSKAKPVDYNYLDGRRFEQYQEFFLENPTANIWQMDTVEGKKGGSAVLSLLFTKTNLQLYFKIPSICTEEVKRVFEGIKKHLGDDLFKETFECILTDNGKENRNPESIEYSLDGTEKLINIFYCEPRRSDQKGKCEKNHEHLREIIPKGRSMDKYGQKVIDRASNHINNYPRKKLGYLTPLEVSSKLLNEKVFELNNLKGLPTHKVTLKHLSK